MVIRMAAQKDNGSSDGRIERIRGQLETIEKYVSRDIDRIDEAIVDIYRRLNDLEKILEKVRGAWWAIGISAAIIGTLFGWVLQTLLVAWRINSAG